MRGLGTLILGYHRVIEADRDPYGVCVHPERFAAQLAELRRQVDVVPLASLDRRAARPWRPRVALTFDDGYRDNLERAYPLLRAYGMPATFFITAGMIDADQEFWWDRLQGLLLARDASPTPLEIEVGGSPLWLDARDQPGAERAHRALHHRLLGATPAVITQVLDELTDQLGVDPAPRPDHLPLTGKQLTALAAGDGVEIGAHSLHHPALAKLPVNEQRTEVHGSKRALEERLDRAVRRFAYPFGGPDAVSGDTVRCVQEAGFVSACTTLTGRVRRRTDRLRLPRCTVRDWDASEFTARLQRWLVP